MPASCCSMGIWGSLKDSISRDLAFCPPFPPTYTLAAPKCSDPQEDPVEVKIKIPRALAACPIKLYSTSTPRMPDGGGDGRIVLAWIPFDGTQSSHTILYSHPNALDLGQCIPYCLDLSKLLAVNVLTFDYTGYGASEGIPSVRHSRADIAAAYLFLREHVGLAEQDIVLMGASLGSGPAVHLAAQRSDIAGLILQSPLLSGIRVLKPKLKWWPAALDVFPNHQLIKKVNAPTLVMHGTRDEVIAVHHGKTLHATAGNPYSEPLWAEGYTHQNVSMSPDYIPTLRKFLDHIW